MWYGRVNVLTDLLIVHSSDMKWFCVAGSSSFLWTGSSKVVEPTLCMIFLILVDLKALCWFCSSWWCVECWVVFFLTYISLQRKDQARPFYFSFTLYVFSPITDYHIQVFVFLPLMAMSLVEVILLNWIVEKIIWPCFTPLDTDPNGAVVMTTDC
jgi:hypothetical protein